MCDALTIACCASSALVVAGLAGGIALLRWLLIAVERCEEDRG